MPVIKNILRKAKNSFQGLKNVDVFIEDTDPNSKYFNIFDLPDELPLGCSSFLIEGSELLKKEVNLKIELLDSENNVVFTTPVDNYLEDKSRRVSIEVYEDVAAGVATLTILGELDPTKTSVPQGFRDVYNVRFNKRININKTKENDRPIRFYGPPTISVSEIVKGVIEETTGGTNQTSTVTGTIGLNVTTNKVLDSEIDVELPTNNIDDLGEKEFISSQTPKSKRTTTFNSKIGKKGKKKKKQKQFKATYSITGNVVAMGAGTNNSTNKITSDFVGATLTITNPHQLVDTEKFPTTRYSLPTSYSTIISEVVNEKTFKVQTPYYVTDDTTKRIPVSLKSATNNASITYDSYVEETESTTFKRSYADITIGNLRTFSGDVYKAKIFTRDSNTPTDFEKIYDAFVEPPNVLIDQTSATGFTNIGFFHQQSDINNNWESSSIGGSEGVLAEQNNEYLIDGLLLSGSVENLDSLVEFRTKNSFDLEKDVDYVVKFDSYFFKDIAEFKSDIDTISTEKRADLKVFLSGSGLTGNAGEEDYYLGKVEIPTNSNDEGEISNVVGSFRSAGSGSPKAWLKFKLKSGRFVIKDVSIEPFSEENFNPNYFRTIVPMPGLVNVKRGRLFDFRAEFYDVNNNEADVGATLERANFDGVPTIIQGTDNKITGSVLVGESVEIYGTNPAYIRSVGYEGFDRTISNNKGGFMIFSGSIGSGAAGGNRINASETYEGVGLEIVDAHGTPDRFLKFRTNPSEFTVQTDQFFFGKDGQFISGSNGNIVISSSNFFLGGESTFVSGSNDKLEISSSNFHLDNDGSVIMQGTITATAGGQIGGFTIGSASMFSGANEVNTTFFLSGSGHSGTNFVKSNLVISSSGFQVNSTGEISSSAGRIGGFTLTDDGLRNADRSIEISSTVPSMSLGTGQEIMMRGVSNSPYIALQPSVDLQNKNFGEVGVFFGVAGGSTPKFSLVKDSNNQFLFNGNTLQIDTPKFSVSTAGNITATGGTIGGFTITDTELFSLDSGTPDSSPNNGITIDTTGGSNSKAVIRVFDGTTENAALGNFASGKFGIKAIEGDIGGFTIDTDEIKSTNLLLDSNNEKITVGSANAVTIQGGGTDNFITMGKTTFGQTTTVGAILGMDATVPTLELFKDANNKFIFNNSGIDIKSTTFDLNAGSGKLIIDSSTPSISLTDATAKLIVGNLDSVTDTSDGDKGIYAQGDGKLLIKEDSSNYIQFNGGLDIKTETFKLDTDRLDIDSSTSRISVFDDAGSPKEVVRIGEVDDASNFGMKIFDGTGTADGDILVEFSETTNNIAGWVIGTSTIQGGNLVLNKEGTIESADFSSGNIAGSGTGFRLSALDNGFLEVENARIRGTLSTAVFEKETVNAVGGQLLIGNSTTITGSGGLSGVTASSATMSVANVTGFTGSYNGFNAAGAVSNINNVDGEILIIKKVDNTGFSTEYVCVNSASRNTPSDDNNLSGLLYVTRSFGLGTGTLGAGPGSNFTGSVGEGAKNYEDGQVIVSTGRYISGTGESTVGTGYINLNARPTDGATPYIDIVERTGSKVYEMDLKARLGDLSGISTAKVGSSPGFGLFTDRAFLTQDVTVGTLSGEHILISGSYLAFKNNNTIMAQLEGTTWTLGGQTGTTEDAIKITPGGVFIYDNSNDRIEVTSDGLNVFEGGNNVASFGSNSTITGGTITLRNATNNNDKVVISENSFEVFDNNNTVASFGANTILEGGTITLRNTTNNNDNVVISENSFVVNDNGNEVANFGANTILTGGTITIRSSANNNDKLVITEDSLTISDNNNAVASFGANTILEGGTVTIRNTTNNNDKVVLSENKLEVFDNNNVVAEFGANTVIEGGTITLQNTTNNNDKLVLSEDSMVIFDNNNEVASFGANTILEGGTITLRNTANNDDNVVISEDSFVVNDNGTSVASFGATTTIGNTATEHVSISSTELKIKDGNGSGTDIDYVTINSSGMSIGNNISLGTNGNATFSGNVQIGSGNSIFKADSNGIYLGNATFGSAPFRVTPAGALTATNATLTGAVTATSGDIAGWTISGNDIIKTTGTNLKTIQLDSNTPKILIQSGSGGTANFNEIRMDANAGNIKVRQDGVQVFNTGDRIQPVTAQSFIVKSLPLSSTTLGSEVPVTTVTHLSASQQIGTNNLVVDEIFRMKALEADLASKTPFYVSITDPLSQTKAVGSNATPIFFEVSKSYDAMDPAHEIGQSAVFSTVLNSADDGGRFVGSSNTTGSAIYHFQTILTEASANHFDDAKLAHIRSDVDVHDLQATQQKQFVHFDARTSSGSKHNQRVFQVQYDGDVVSAGNITAFGASSNFLNVSDKRLKKDIHTISESLDRILELRPTEFVWKENEKRDIGFIAQEVEEIIPEIVETSEGFLDTHIDDDSQNNIKTVSYPKLIPYLVDTIQVLTKRIEELEKKVK